MRSPVLAALALAVPAATSSAQTIETLLLEGDVLGPFQTVGDVLEVSVNAQGSWLARVRSPLVGLDEMLVVDGEVVLRNPMFLAPVQDVLDGLYESDLDAAGTYAAPLGLVGLTGGVYRDDELLLQAGDLVAGLPWLGFQSVASGGTDALLVRGTIDGPALGAEDGALVKVVLDPVSGDVLTQEPLAILGQDLAGLGPVSVVPTAHGVFSIDPGGSTAFVATTAAGTVLVADGTPIAIAGEPSPVPGFTWSGFGSVDRAGAHLSFLGILSPFGGAIVRDGAVLVKEGDTLPSILPYLVERIDYGLRVSARGDVIWHGRTDHPDPAQDGGIFRNERRLVEEGASTAEGYVIARLDLPGTFGAAYAPDASPDGRFVVFRAELADGREGVFRLDLGAAEQVPGCSDNPGDLALAESLLVPGGEIALELDGAQAPGALAFVAISAAAATDASGCGPAVPGFGELLVDLGRSHLLLLTGGGAWTGAPVAIAIDLPASPALAGLELFAQGAFVSAGTPGEPVRATNGLALVLGS